VSKTNTPDFVARTIGNLSNHGINCALFGGWAEEALGLCSARPHGDIDFLLQASSFEHLDNLLAASLDEIEEIPLKRFAHKRAFLLDGVAVEVILVEQANDAASTWFWGDVCFDWLMPLANLGVLHGYPMTITSRENLNRYRANFRLTEPHRWKDSASLVSRKQHF
jgi:hypothetical protein